jgi:hypothetical protein
MVVARLVLAMRDARWLTRARIVAGGQALALIQLTILIMLALWQHGVITDRSSPTSSDFVSFYAAGKLALNGTPALAYDQAAHFQAQMPFTVPGSPYQYFFYPPILLLLFAPLALLPYTLAFYLFEFATLGGFLLTMRAVLRQPGWDWIGPVIAFPAIFWTFGLGQNAFLTAALFAGFTLLVQRRPALAGMLLGYLCYKPHFGLLAPVALAFGGQWRAFLATVGTVLGLVGLSAALFGVDTWHAYLTAFAGSDAIYSSDRIDYAGIVTIFGAARLLGFGPSAAYVAQAFCVLGAAGAVALTWRSREDPATRGAVLLSATLLAMPLALLYDQMLLLVAIAWLVRDGVSSRQKPILVAIYLIVLFEYAIGSAWALPLGPLASLLVLFMALRRGARDVTAAYSHRARGMVPLPVR